MVIVKVDVFLRTVQNLEKNHQYYLIESTTYQEKLMIFSKLGTVLKKSLLQWYVSDLKQKFEHI